MDFMKLIHHVKEVSPLKDLGSISSRDIIASDSSRFRMLMRDKDLLITTLQKELKEKDNFLLEVSAAGATENLNQVQKLREEIDKLKGDNTKLELKNKELEDRLSQLSDIGGINNLLNDYEKMLGNLLSRCLKLEEEKNLVCKHLACLEFAFNDLLEKYERAKTIIFGFQKNQDVLLSQATKYESNLNNLEEKNKTYVEDTQKKINEFVEQLTKREKVHIGEVAKLKTKILQSQVKINDLEKKLSMAEKVSSNLSETSLFQPLSNDIYKA
ncbi:transforming acidic coiled-coil-containing protein 1-like [Agrilus planipennis]|uniref:Transforming acidic coiled-coil-containing protein 1-like n=1 Tax=Agrilus planipennis TaxID=224129 RepID=A0A1W4X285_AGRPL|nr:transforming acidic coiled-coil-containing protein 1-like [Agrilus planipennis]